LFFGSEKYISIVEKKERRSERKLFALKFVTRFFKIFELGTFFPSLCVEIVVSLFASNLGACVCDGCEIHGG
jgi:hypothetical protein